jgi:PEP-CTERM motif
MKKVTIAALTLMSGILISSSLALADTNYNNYTGSNAYWHPLGYPNSATYGETFTAPTNGDNFLQSIGFYLGEPYVDGNIVMQAYVATWTGSQADTLLYSSSVVNYANTGEDLLMFNPGISLAAGDSYVMFLSISENYGQSSGEAYVNAGDASIPGSSFVYYNNSGDFSALFNSSWDSTGLTPNMSVQANFTGGEVPEPSTMLLFGAGLAGLAGFVRRK